MVSKSKSRSSLTGGAIAGIVIAALVLLILLAAAAFYLVRRRRNTKSPSRASLPTFNSPVQNHGKIAPYAPQLPNPTINHLSDKDVERMYLKSAASVGNDDETPDPFAQATDRPAPRGKLAQLTGEIAPRGRIQRLKPADERRTVPYQADDFA